MPHTILSIRQSLSAGPCKIRKFANVNACLEDVCRMYELLLRHQQGNPASVTYEIEHLFQFIDKVSFIWIEQENVLNMTFSCDERGFRVRAIDFMFDLSFLSLAKFPANLGQMCSVPRVDARLSAANQAMDEEANAYDALHVQWTVNGLIPAID